MHKFIDNIVAFSLKNKFFIFFCTAIAIIAGAVSFKHTPIDAFPDVTNTKVTIITQWAGRSAEEVEKFITIPIEIAMNPVQKKTDIRSTTLFGLSVINVMFEAPSDTLLMSLSYTSAITHTSESPEIVNSPSLWSGRNCISLLICFSTIKPDTGDFN